jgi:hypothetical protein
MMPVSAVASETGCVEAKHGANLAGAKPGNKLLEAWACHGAAGRTAEVVVDDLDRAKSVAARSSERLYWRRWLSRLTCTCVCVD